MDEPAFRALFDSTYRALARYASHRGLGRDDAEDLIASTYEVAWRRQDAVPEGDEALMWLYTVAHNQLRNLWRRRQRDSALVARLPRPTHAEPPSEPGDPPMREIVRALDALGGDDRELILLVALDGLRVTEAAVVLGCGPNAARKRLQRARARLAELLESPPEESRSAPLRHEEDENDTAREVSQ